MAKKISGKRGRPSTIGASEYISAKFPPELVERIEVWAAAGSVTRSEAMRRLIEAGLRQMPKSRKTVANGD
jgi:metal-responsive CopG/Arc/MetJ family transcriptional regulator